MQQRTCRFCDSPLSETFVDLGVTPLSNSYVRAEDAHKMEPFYPLQAQVCGNCLLVQLEQFESPQRIFCDYLYFSSFSDSWLRHAESYAESMIERLGLDGRSQVTEIASNDGYLLQFFDRRDIPVLGVEPAANVAEVAIKKGIPTDISFFGVETAGRLERAGIAPDLIIANNVLAHVPDLHDFVSGFKKMLKSSGTITVEFPHLLRLMEQNQFDTIYHEHVSYFSFLVVEKIFSHHGLTVFDVEDLPTHGGSLRIYARHIENQSLPLTPAVASLRKREENAGLYCIDAYRQFANQVVATKCAILDFFLHAKQAGKKIVAYGAAAKGNTLLNYCGIRTDFIEFTVDRSPHKQGLLLPGTRIPIRHPNAILDAKPDYVIVLPWNLKDEIIEQMSVIRSWNGKFVVPIPNIQIIP
jgi:2-polyprenyl-3-methyl-5-hydroxy-6-metoxy-1,4-benzoquinol methylase